MYRRITTEDGEEEERLFFLTASVENPCPQPSLRLSIISSSSVKALLGGLHGLVC
jgi:hypothetical protein